MRCSIQIGQNSVAQISSLYSSDSLIITLHNASFSVRYDGGSDDLRKKQIKAMKLAGVDGQSQYGHTFTIASTAGRDGGLSNLGGPVCIYNQNKNYIGSVQDKIFNSAYTRRLIIAPNGNNYQDRMFEYNFSPNSLKEAVFSVGGDKLSDFKKSFYAIDGNNFSGYQKFGCYKSSFWLEIKTDIDAKDVKVTAKVGSRSYSFTAQGNILSLPSGSFETMQYTFRPLEIDASSLVFTNNVAPLDITFEVKATDGRVLVRLIKRCL